jgi:hypothetical protein
VAASVYMVGEKAADVILREAAHPALFTAGNRTRR